MKGIIPAFKPISILSLFFKGLVWTMPNDKNEVYLTFDDGPIPGITSWVLDLLLERNIKATFFCVGDNVKKHFSLYERILDEGHSVGNHTQNHKSGWKLKNENYKQEIDEAARLIDSNLFRPPYGQISPGQFAMIREQYKVVMWDVLSKDYDNSVSTEECIENVTKNVKSGSIIVMHDSIKAGEKLKSSLPRILDYLETNCFILKPLPYNKSK